MVVGGYIDTSNHLYGFLYSAGVFTDIDDPAAVGHTGAIGLNNLGEVVGAYFDSSNGDSQGFLDNNGVFTTIDFPNAAKTELTAINDNGTIVGNYYDSTNKSHGFVYSGGIFTTIDYPGMGTTQITGINSNGTMVVIFEPDMPNGNKYTYSFLYSGGVFTPIVDLNQCNCSIDALDAFAINDSGVVVGGESRTPLPLPTPEPRSLYLAFVGIVVLILDAKYSREWRPS